MYHKPKNDEIITITIKKTNEYHKKLQLTDENYKKELKHNSKGKKKWSQHKYHKKN